MNARFAVKPSMGGIRTTPVVGNADGESAPAGYAAVTMLHEMKSFPIIPDGKMTFVDKKTGIAFKTGITHGNRQRRNLHQRHTTSRLI
jgi:hypothetical protein